MQPPNDAPHYYRLELIKGMREWITSNQRLFWRVRSDRTKAWRSLACARAKEMGLPPMEQARIVAEFRFSDKRRRDPANWYPTVKACVDGLVDAGMFPDDNAHHVLGPDMRLGPVVNRGWQGIHPLIHPTEIQ